MQASIQWAVASLGVSYRIHGATSAGAAQTVIRQFARSRIQISDYQSCETGSDSFLG
jgi:hypothetical protein